MNLICKLLGHKLRNTSYWEFKRKNGEQVRRKITQTHCDRCEETKVENVGSWEREPIKRKGGADGT